MHHAMEWFMAAIRRVTANEVLPKSIRARVSIEAGVAQPWYRFIGDSGIAISVETVWCLC